VFCELCECTIVLSSSFEGAIGPWRCGEMGMCSFLHDRSASGGARVLALYWCDFGNGTTNVALVKTLVLKGESEGMERA